MADFISIRYVGERLMQCKDLPDALLLDVIQDAERYATLRDVHDGLADRIGPVPWNLVLAKLRGLIARGLVDGCACGCAGGFTVVAPDALVNAA
ncbi:hypothetical protein [Streptomyces sp. NRRL F-5630]|uniref:hypothetical protein n=1 Tax=Streptomyces sp. NRRL F-5630 TaxID=1463864 RepID=UPI003D722F17